MHTLSTREHTPVLLNAVLRCLAPQPGESYLDVTAGYGGHAAAVLAITSAPQQATLVDRDSTAIAALGGWAEQGAQVIHRDFLAASRELQADGRCYDMILADLGVSSVHLDRPERGFAFRLDGALDMRMDQSGGQTAADLVNGLSIDELALVLRRYGEEYRARTIAAAIVAARPLSSTGQLAEVIRRPVPATGRGKVHPATKSFQALRIAVNDELHQVEQALPIWLELLKPGGRLAVISFHSLEDRLVKRAFTDATGDRYDAPFKLLTKHPVVADDAEISFNPRARSAKLRALQQK